MTRSDFLAEIAVIRDVLDTAAQTLLGLSEQGLDLAQAQFVDAAAIETTFLEVLQTCAFQDLAGQRLDRLSKQITGDLGDARPDADLLHGPANGNGLDQSAADALFEGR